MANAVGNTREDQVRFLSGVNADGTLASPTFATHNGDTPDTYGTMSRQFHWGPANAAGTGGGTLTYEFDPDSNWTATEQAALASSLSMWSAVANISFAALRRCPCKQRRLCRISPESSKSTIPTSPM